MSKKNRTPMMEQYYSIKERYPDAILFFRLGDFYEMFDDDAELAARLLEITLTARNKQADDPIPMCGVPYHSAKEYIRRLVEQGYKVAICEQLEDPRQTKGMVKRDVVQVVTPGTILADEALEQKENNYLAAIATKQGRYLLAYVDVSTGEIFLTQTKDYQQFHSELLNVQPTEILIEEETDEALVSKLQAENRFYFTNFTKSESDKKIDQIKLDQAQVEELELLDFLLQYLYSVQKRKASHLQAINRYELSEYLQMNYYAKTQLELTESLRTGRKEGSLLSLIDKTQTAMGGRLLRRWLDKPLLHQADLEKRHKQVAQLLNHYFERVDLQEVLKNIYDLERLVTKIAYRTAVPKEIDQLRNSLHYLPSLNKILALINGEDSYFPYLNEFKDLLALIDKVLVESPANSAEDGQIIQDAYNEELDSYRDALNHGQEWLEELQQSERERTGLKTLKVGYNRVFGYYIEISRLQAQDLKDDRYQRKQTLANSERFITDELKEMETRILTAQEKAQELEYQLFVDLRQSLADYIESLQLLSHQVAELDVLANFARVSEEENFVQAEISTHNHDFYLEDSRHPTVEKNIGSSNFVPNDFKTNKEEFVLLLTGPNMSGKSTYMRQVAYCVILNQIGCFVPAKKARLSLVDQIFTRLGSADDISSGESTFMVEMKETNIALENATPRSLLLLDEIGRGTATFDGMALAESILYYIAQEVGATTIFSTHYHELTALADQIAQLKNIYVGAEESNGEVVFLHKVMDGVADKSYGIHVAKLAGLPEQILQQSQEVLDELEHNSQYLRPKEAKAQNQSQAESHQEGQLSLFEVQEAVPALTPSSSTPKLELQSLLEDICQQNIGMMTPLEALNYLNDIQQKIRNEGQE